MDIVVLIKKTKNILKEDSNLKELERRDWMNQKAIGSQKGLALLKALFVSYIITGILLLLLALIMYKAKPPEGVIGVGIIFTYIFSAFAGGLVAGKSAAKKRFAWGLLLGILYFLVILAVSFVLDKEIISRLGSTIMVFFMCGLGGMLGGMIS